MSRMSHYKLASEKRYNELDAIFQQLCGASGGHAGIVTPDDLAAAAKMSPESARKWLRALCKAKGYQWVSGHCLCPEAASESAPLSTQ